MLLINGAERWAELAFRARTPARSMIDMLWSGDAGPRRWLVLLGLMASWLLVGVLLRAVADMTPSTLQGSRIGE